MQRKILKQCTHTSKLLIHCFPIFRLVHIMDQRELRRGEGPIALVLVPTRELALQIYTEVRRYCRVSNNIP